MPTLDQIKIVVTSLDPKLHPDDDAYKAAVVLLAGVQVGADRDAVAEFTGYDLDWVGVLADRLGANHVWIDGKTACDWFDDEHGGMNLWIDVGVALGHLVKVDD